MENWLLMFWTEILGTALLILMGNGVVSNVVLKNTKGHNSGWIVITMGWALAVGLAAAISASFGGVAHFNPAVSIAFAIGNIDAIGGNFGMFFVLLGGQIIGGIIGQLLVDLLYIRQITKHLSQSEEATEIKASQADILAVHSTGPALKSYGINLVTEYVATIVLILGIMATSMKNFFNIGGLPVGFMGPLMAGLLILGIGISLGGLTGYALNPIRDMVPRLVHQVLPIKNKGKSDWAYSWVPVLGPMLAGVTVGLVALAF